jgi:hypothetical protein
VLVTHQMWVAIHGLVTLELGDYLIDPCNAAVCLEAQLIGLMVGAGDAPETARRSVELSRTRLEAGVLAAGEPLSGSASGPSTSAPATPRS